MGVCGPVGAAGGGGPFDRLRANGFWKPRVRWGVGDAMGDRGAPRRAPALGSRESGNDDGGCGGMRWRGWLVSGWGPALAGGRFSNRPYDRGGAHEGGGDAGAAGGGGAPFVCPQDRLRRAQGERIWEARVRWGVGDAMGDGDAPRRAPLPWVPVFTGTTMGGWWSARAGGGGGPPSCVLRTGFDRLRANGFGRGACDGVLAGLGSRWGVVVGRRHASGFLRCAGSRVGGDGGTVGLAEWCGGGARRVGRCVVSGRLVVLTLRFGGC